MACLIAAIPVSVLAGMRSLDVGTDTTGYPLSVYEYSLSHSFLDTFLTHSMYVGPGTIDPLFVVFGWAITRVFRSFGALLFWTQFITVVPVIVSCKILAPKQISVGLFTYSLVFFPFSLNIIKQSIAMAWLLLMATYLLVRRQKRATACLVIALGFHITSLIGIIIWAIVKFWTRINSSPVREKERFLFLLATIGLCVSFIFVGAKILPYLVFLKSNAFGYHVAHMGEGDLSICGLLLGVAAICVYALLWKSYGAKSEKLSSLRVLLLLSVIGAIVSQYSVVSPEIGRLGTIFQYQTIVFFALALQLATKEKMLIGLIVIVICVTYFMVSWVPTELVPWTAAMTLF